MSLWLQPLPVLPVLVPMMAAAAMLLTRDVQRPIRVWLAAISFALQGAVALLLLAATLEWLPTGWPDGIGVYLLGNWPAPFGIVLVVDRLSALMLGLTALLGICTWIYATARWDNAGSHFHPLFQFILMGLNGAFLAGDLFNLFVFFEILLTASYGLMLHGSGKQRVTAALHYIGVNLIASFLLLIAIALIYGLTGTLNFADLALRAQVLHGADRRLFDSAAAILGIAFLIKAAAWPLNFWLPSAYSQACAPVGALFAIMTKVGIYALLRIGSLLLPAGAPAAFGGAWMFPAGIATLAFGTLGMLASTEARRIAAYAVITSSGTLFAALGMPGVTLTGPALYYLLSSVAALASLFLLLELTERSQPFGADMLAITQEAFETEETDAKSLSEQTVGEPLPATMAFLGLSFFACALLIIGLPPLSGFVAKFSLLSAALRTAEYGAPTLNVWLLVTAMLVSGLACLMALGRCGVRLFWIPETLQIPRLKIREIVPILILLSACGLLTVQAGPALDYLDDTAYYLNEPGRYVQAVLGQDSRHPDAAQAAETAATGTMP
ncbi:MAG: monovalent cation/H+ antiporter subunit D [Castellaniella sp.]|uniref:monovalent cation/H+ antiporter subunit D n=1 Tax=Castellaniella sp. TaxID=1955812 RepID=UPI001209A727|nr:monovalent cation/H+ antiporter subunit D [Castellaniella sp.]TAN29923.1 MAG: monovalent cation/H+ antiporter subunit D [Castellaniella sp.]